MDPQQVLTISRDGLLTLLVVCGPIVLVVLAVGLVVSIFQAATQIHEATLSFVPKLLAAFQQFFREHADIWSQGFDYKEAAPQLIMQAFLQRIINGGGRINREYGLGRKRTDLFIEWPTDPAQGMYGPLQRVVIELKMQRGALEPVLAQGLEQTADYVARVGADEAHLVIFNRTPEVPWDEKIWQRQERFGALPIAVWGA